MLGRYIVADPAICHGKLTFLGTRIMVFQVMEMIADGMDWDTIVDEWDGKVSKEAIAEAVTLASQALASPIFADHLAEYNHEPAPA
jgi:uncharacterized protein (DUF433 family)